MADDPPAALTPALCRSTRRARGWSVRRLARRAGLVAATIERFEAAEGRANPGTIRALRRALAPDGPVVSHGGAGTELAEESSAEEVILPGAEPFP